MSSSYKQVEEALCSVHMPCSEALHSALLHNTTSLLDVIIDATDNCDTRCIFNILVRKQFFFHKPEVTSYF